MAPNWPFNGLDNDVWIWLNLKNSLWFNSSLTRRGAAGRNSYGLPAVLIILILEECWVVQEAEDVMFISTSTNLTQRNLSNLPTYLPTYQPNQSFNLLIDFNQLHNWDDFQYMNSKTLKDPNLQHPTAHEFFNQGNTVKMKDLGEKKSISYKWWQFLYYARFSHSGQNWTPLTHLSANPSTIFRPWCGKHSLEAGAPTAKSWKRSTPKDLGHDTQNTAANSSSGKKIGYYKVPSRAWILPWLLQKAEIDRLLRIVLPAYSLHIFSN